MASFSFCALFVLIIIGIPIASVLGLVGLIGLGIEMSWATALGQLKDIAFSATAEYTLAVIPLFMLMGNFAASAGLGKEAYDCARMWFGRFPGSLAIATNIAAAAFGAVSGSTMASASLFTRLSFPEMVKSGYDKRLALGCICVSGALACMIPPSILIVLYGVIAGESIGKLLIGGIFPGVMTALIYSIGIALVVMKFPALAPKIDARYSLKEKIRSFGPLWPILVLFVLVMGGLYFGFVTPTEAAGVGALGALVLGIIQRRLTPSTIWAAVVDAGVLNAALLIIIVFGTLYGFYLSVSGFVDQFVFVVQSITTNRYLLIFFFIILYTILGMFIDPISMMIITLPLVHPLAMKIGLDPTWFGIFIVKMCEIAVLTPPLGMNLYAVKLTVGQGATLGEIITGTLYFLILEFFSLALMIFFPQIVTFLPNLMK